MPNGKLIAIFQRLCGILALFLQQCDEVLKLIHCKKQRF